MTGDIFVGERSARYHGDGLTNKEWSGLKIEVMSREAAENYIPESLNEVCISIKSASQYAMGFDREALLSNKFFDILRLTFDDVAMEMMNADDDDVVFFNADMARRIIAFIQKYKNGTDKIVIHCFAGISRSRSIAAAITEYLELPYTFTVYNTDVYKILTREFKYA